MNPIPDLDQQYLDHWMRLFNNNRMGVSTQFCEAFKLMHQRLSAYMRQDRALLATMASNMQGTSPSVALNHVRQILAMIDGDIK